jgi:hypothetical protein
VRGRDPAKGDGGYLLINLGRAGHVRAMVKGAIVREAGLPLVDLRSVDEVLVNAGDIGEVQEDGHVGLGSDEHAAVFPLIHRW